MTDLLDRAMQHYESRLLSHLRRPIRYRRGPDYFDTYCTIGETIFESQDNDGFNQNHHSRDFLVSISLLPFGEPQRGDIIEDYVVNVESIKRQSIIIKGNPSGGTFKLIYGDPLDPTNETDEITYNATPEELLAALELLPTFPSGAIVAGGSFLYIVLFPNEFVSMIEPGATNFSGGTSPTLETMITPNPIGFTTRVYEVMAPAAEPVWRFGDDYRYTYRIHTKEVGAA